MMQMLGVSIGINLFLSIIVSLTVKTIGILSWDYGQPKGGMARSLQHLVSALRHAHIPMCILAPRTNTSDAPTLAFTHRVGGQILFSLLLPFVLNARIIKKSIDHLLLPVGPGGVLLFRRSHVPATAIVFHTYAQQARSVPGQWWKYLFTPFERRTLSLCNHIICFCSDTKDALMAAYGISNEKITVLPHAVNIPASVSDNEQGLCVCVARLERRKGVDILLRAWPSIHRAVPHARLILVGDGVMRGSIDAMIRSTSNVERRSSVSQEEMQHLLQSAQIVSCPSYLEGFGLACAEAMAAECAVVASDVDGLRSRITQGVNGVLVPAGDSESLSAAMIGLLSQPLRCHELGIAALKTIRQSCDPMVSDRAFVDAVRSACATL